MTAVPANSVGPTDDEGHIVRRVARLMLTAPSDAATDGDAFTPGRVGELIGRDRDEVLTTWKSVLADWGVRARSLEWGAAVRQALLELEGVGTLTEVSVRALRTHPEHTDAYGLTRAVVELGDEASLIWRRTGCQVVIATASSGPDHDGHLVIDHAAEFRHMVSALVAGGEVVSTERLLSAIAISPELRALAHLSPRRLSALASAMSPHVLSNRRGDLYLVGLRPTYALAAVSDSLPIRDAPVDEVRRRVRGRFPGASPLPADAELRELIQYTVNRTRVAGRGPSMGMGTGDAFAD